MSSGWMRSLRDEFNPLDVSEGNIKTMILLFGASEGVPTNAGQ
jgi:hypothetical protein